MRYVSLVSLEKPVSSHRTNSRSIDCKNRRLAENSERVIYERLSRLDICGGHIVQHLSFSAFSFSLCIGSSIYQDGRLEIRPTNGIPASEIPPRFDAHSDIVMCATHMYVCSCANTQKESVVGWRVRQHIYAYTVRFANHFLAVHAALLRGSPIRRPDGIPEPFLRTRPRIPCEDARVVPAWRHVELRRASSRMMRNGRARRGGANNCGHERCARELYTWENKKRVAAFGVEHQRRERASSLCDTPLTYVTPPFHPLHVQPASAQFGCFALFADNSYGVFPLCACTTKAMAWQLSKPCRETSVSVNVRMHF